MASCAASALRIRRALKEELGYVLVAASDLKWQGIEPTMQAEVARVLFVEDGAG